METSKAIVQIVVARRGKHDLIIEDDVIYSGDEGKGKKHALLRAAKVATADYLWFRDDDVVFSEWSIDFAKEQIIADRKKVDMYILPLNMRGNGSLICRLQQLEYVALQSLTMLTAEHDMAVMCSGANLIVKREEWLKYYADIHLELPSGDDMFMLESFKRHHLNIKPLYSPALIGTTNAKPTMRELLSQRMRWAGKAPHYTDKHIVCCGILVVLSNLLIWLLPVFVIKYAIDCWLIQRGWQYYNLLAYNKSHRYWWLLAVVLEIVYPLYMLVCLVGGLMHPKRW